MKTKLTISNETIFVFDIHGVIFKLDTIKIIKEIFKTNHKLKLCSLLFYPKVFLKTISELRNGAIAEEILFKLGKLYPQFQELLPLGFKIINSQKPIHGTVNAIKSLKEKGYKLYILSNIGEESMKMMEQQFPEVFKHFDGIMASTAKDGYIKKPNPEAFEKYLATFNQKRNNIVFIDDRPININAARKIDIPTILFTSPKNFTRALKELLAI